jgi:hypothetical protein
MIIKSLNLKQGSSKDQQPLEIGRPRFVIFVGPNNSGKSQILRDVCNMCRSGNGLAGTILSNIQFQELNTSEAKAIVEKYSSAPRQGEPIHPENRYQNIGGTRFEVHLPQMMQALTAPNSSDGVSRIFASYHSSHFTVNFDGPSRMSLLDAQYRGDLKYPSSSFARLFVDDKARAAVRSSIFDAIGFYFGVDASEGDRLQIRFGETAPPNERSLEEATIEWMRNAKSVSEVSDGVRAFTGIMIQLAVGEPKVIVIDEPEAFLHPSLAFTLGKEIGKSSTSSEKQVFVATHSPQFLMGAIQSGADIDIVRLTYAGGMGTARLLPTTEVKLLMRDPFLRSANVLAGLFHESVIITEADADRAFYQEVNERLLDTPGFSGIINALFLNSNGKDTLHRIAKPLRSLGVPAAVIADIDALCEGGTNWSNQLKGYSIPEPQHQAFASQRDTIWKKLKRDGKDPKVEGGISILGGEDREAAENLVIQLAEYGFFIVQKGEVERWLEGLQVSRSKHNWLREIFEAMGQDSTDVNYVRPDGGDVWSFIGDIRRWLNNPTRKGIPS